MVPLKDGTKLDHCTALELLHGGMITMQDIVNKDDHSVSLLAVPSNTPSDNEDHHKQSVPPSTTSDVHLCHGLQSMSNDEDDCEQSVPPNIPLDAHLSHALQNMLSDEDDCEQSCHPPCTPQKVSYNDQSMESEEDEQAVAVVMHSEDPADFGEVYHASNVDHQPSGIVSRLSESDEDGLAAENGPLTLRCGRLPIDALQKAQALGVCTTQEAQAIADEYGKTLVSIMATAGLTTKATWAESVWNIHQACGNDEAACQAQGVFAGSSLCMQLASERQTDVAKLLDFLSMIIKYKILDSAASIPLPNFALLLQKSYDHTLALQSQEKFHEAKIKCGQKNIPWKVLLDLLFVYKHTIVDWPAGVLAVGPDFNVKHLNADEFHALTVPFLKEQMEQDYNLEAPADEEEDHFVPVPASLFYLKHWTADQLQLLCKADLKDFDIPLVVNMLHHSLRLISNLQASVKALPPTMHRKGPDQEAVPCLPPPPAKAQPHPHTRGCAALNTHNACRPPPASEYSPLPPSSLPDNSPCSSPP
ncbi:hypothetical protein M404DRAFT_27032 [Pisolithus tinctorius Marx 270]|uniref:Uncharacterized protein n=1 Tax=Pisolithus tinctorius Marx 270 TaxID=870435 RepID=A0A0C3K1H6_PISTI|nr:hypothetical protein M404DRAFT_27032 [Pisolithus tinctorius Marx 270]